MNTLDRQLLDELNDIPGWNTLTASPAPTASPEALTRSTLAVREAIAADAARAMSADLIRSGVHPITRSRRRRAPWVVAALVGVGAAALVVAGVTVTFPGRTPEATPGGHPVPVHSASVFLVRLASKATAAPGIDDAYWKVRFTSSDPLRVIAGSDPQSTTTLWYGRTGGRWITDGSGTVVKASDTNAPFVIGADLALTWSQVNALPGDPAQLEASLQSTLGPTSIPTGVARLLASAPLSAAQRSALFTILSHQPGVTMRDGVKDTTGRVGTALTFPFGPTKKTQTEMVTLLLTADGTLLEVLETAIMDQPAPATTPVPAPSQLEGRVIPPAAVSTPGAIVPTVSKGDVITRTTYLEMGGTNTVPGH
jgi:hypothetical protein